MGGAYLALADDVSTQSVNPAGLASMCVIEAGFMHSIWVEDLSLEQLAVGFPAGRRGGIAIGLGYLNYGSFDKVTLDSAGLPVVGGSVNANALETKK